VEEGVVEGKNDSWLCEPGDSKSCLGVEGRDDGRRGTVSFGTARRPNVDVGGIEIGEEGRRCRSERGASRDDIDDSSFHVLDSAGTGAMKVNFDSSGLVDSGGLSARAAASLLPFASWYASFRVAFESE